MTEAEPTKCPNCNQPIRSASQGSLTQWVAACNCSLVGSEEALQVSLRLCQKCGKRIGKGREGSFTQFVFRHDICSCDEPVPTIAKEEANISAVKKVEIASEESIDVNIEGFPYSRFNPLKELGCGQTGSVFLCRDLLLNRLVAVKVLSNMTAEQCVAFQDEAKAISILDHESIVDIVDFGATESGTPYMVLEFFEGEALDVYLARHGKLSWDSACALFASVASALSYLHGKKVFHRDIKPANILVSKSATGEFTVKLIDFGIAKVTRSQGDTTNVDGRDVVGTPRYMAPEQVRGGGFDSRSEIYSTACVLFEALSGRTPFEGDTALQTMNMHVNDKPPILSQLPDLQIPDPLSELVDNCLAKTPAQRPQTMDELEQLLTKLASGDRFEAEQVVVSQASSSSRKNTIAIALTAIVAICALAAIQLARQPDQSISTTTGSEQMSSRKSETPVIEAKGKYSEPELHLYNQVVSAGQFENLPEMNVKVVRANGCSFSDPRVFELIGRARNVQRLHIRDSTGLKDKALPGLTAAMPADSKLKILLLSETDLDLETLEYLSKIPNLEQLVLSGLPVNDSDVDSLKGLKISYLSLAGTEITDDAIEKLKKLPRLGNLSLRFSHITRRGLEELAGMKSLFKIDIGGCVSLKQIDVAWLRKARPDLNVVYSEEVKSGNIDSIVDFLGK